MPAINQRAGNESLQVGSVGGNLTVNSKGKGLGAWGCFAISVVAIMAGLAGAIIYIAKVTGEAVDKNVPIVASVAMQQATVNASFVVPAYTPSTPVPVKVDSSEVSADVTQFARSFLGFAVQAEARSVTESNDAYVSLVMTGEPLREVQALITTCKSRGMVCDIQFDLSRSYIKNIEVITSHRLQVDSCEYLGVNYYDASTRALAGNQPLHFVSASYTIETTPSGPYITGLATQDPTTSCP